MYSKKHRRPVGVVAHFFQNVGARKVADLWRENEAKVVSMAISGSSRCFSTDNFCWREGNKTAIAKALLATTLTKEQRREVWNEIATQMSLSGKKSKK
jgi:hypothetical protein